AELKENYLKQVGDIKLKAASFQTDIIMQQYQDEIGDLVPQMQSNMENALGETINYIDWSGNAVNGWSYDQISQWLDIDGLDKTTKSALKELWTSMQPQLAGLEELKQQSVEAGKEVPASVSNGIKDVSSIGILVGDENAMFAAIGEAAANSEEYKEVLQQMQENGTYIPETIATAITQNQPAIDDSINTSWQATKNRIESTFGIGLNVDVPVNVNLNTSNSGSPNYAFKDPYATLDGHADGGIFHTPHIAWFAEDGPEAAIPLDGSQRAISLWETAGEMLGVYSDYNMLSKEDSFSSLSDGLEAAETTNYNSQSGAHITYSPTLQFYGGTPNKQDIVEAGRMSQDEFNSMMQRYEKDIGRLCFV
ncbi:hypothetical protein CG709_20410, partial [Lachnotalea glycerini]